MTPARPVTEDELSYFERWADHIEAPSAGYAGDLLEDMKDRARRIRHLVARVRELQAKESAAQEAVA